MLAEMESRESLEPLGATENPVIPVILALLAIVERTGHPVSMPLMDDAVKKATRDGKDPMARKGTRE